MTKADLYYEAHITIDPIEDDLRKLHAGFSARFYGFRLAKLLMDKGVPSQLDTFMTGHGTDLDDIKQRTLDLCRTLQQNGFKVRRYKIEDTVLDSRHSDVFNLLSVKI